MFSIAGGQGTTWLSFATLLGLLGMVDGLSGAPRHAAGSLNVRRMSSIVMLLNAASSVFSPLMTSLLERS